MKFILIISIEKQISNLLSLGVMTLLVYIIAFIAIIISMFLIYKNDKLIRSRDKYFNKSKLLELELQQKNREFIFLQDKLQNIKKESNNSAESSISNNIQIVEIETIKEKEKIETNVKDKWIPDEFYLSTPTQEGTFIGESMYEFNASKVIYKVITSSEDMAFFQIVCNEAIINDVINYPDTLLKPVCEYEGGYNLKAKSIKPIKDGVLKKINGIWKAEKKAIIKFI